MTDNIRTGVALVGGYLLGRTKKAKMAIGLGMFLVGKRLDLDPRHVGKLLANSPVLGSLNDQVRRELVEATRSAATAALTQRAEGLADSLHQRTLGLNRKSEPTAEGDDDAPSALDEEDGNDEKPARRTASEKAARGRKQADPDNRRTASGRTRSASGAARKASSHARSRSGAPQKATASATRKSRGESHG